MTINFDNQLNSFNLYLQSESFQPETAIQKYKALQGELGLVDETVRITALASLNSAEELLNQKISQECPLSHQPIKASDYILLGTSKVAFDANWFMRSVLTQANLENPCTRSPLSDEDLTMLCAHFNIDKDEFLKLVEIKNLHHRYQDFLRILTQADPIKAFRLQLEFPLSTSTDYEEEDNPDQVVASQVAEAMVPVIMAKNCFCLAMTLLFLGDAFVTASNMGLNFEIGSTSGIIIKSIIAGMFAYQFKDE